MKHFSQKLLQQHGLACALLGTMMSLHAHIDVVAAGVQCLRALQPVPAPCQEHVLGLTCDALVRPHAVRSTGLPLSAAAGRTGPVCSLQIF